MVKSGTKNKYILGMFTFLFMLLATGCGYTEEEKALMKLYDANAKVNAVSYIEDKYGFTPTIVNTNVLKVNTGPVPDFTPPPSGRVEVKMRYEGTDFTVNISGEDQEINGSDDYQKDKITNDFKERLGKELSVDIASIDVRYADKNLLEDIYRDLDSFLNSCKGNRTVSIVIKTLDDVSENTVQNINYDTVELFIISCENQENINILSDIEYLKAQEYRYNFYNIESLNNKMMEYALYMRGYVYRSKEGKLSYRSFVHEKIDDNVYLVYDQTEGVGDVKVRRTSDMAPAYDWSRASGKAESLPTFENPKKLGEDYTIDFGTHPLVQIFIKEENRDDSDKAERYIALQYIDEEDREIYTHIAPRKLNGYYSFTLESHKDMKFVLMINQK